MRAPKNYLLPKAVQPESSYEYGCDTPEIYDFGLQERSRNALNLADRAYRDSYGYVRRVAGTRISGRRWDFLEKWDS